MPELIGKETVLFKVSPWHLDKFHNTVVAAWCWETDLSRRFADSMGTWDLVFTEPNLLPIDDENVNNELHSEAIDEVKTTLIEFEKQLQENSPG